MEVKYQEAMARAIAKAHFMRKQHYGACTQEDRVKHMVDAYWKTFIPDTLIIAAEMQVYMDLYYNEITLI
jgi:hypothetical protein